MPSLPTAYRPCVGMMVLNADNLVLVGQRIDNRTEAWQMPQGGIDEGEDLRVAALRELREEIGTDRVDIIAESQQWLAYDLPEHLVPQLWGGKFRGQRQKWFLMRLQGNISDIDIHTDVPEFSATRWVEPHELPGMIVPFKRELYAQVLQEFSIYL